MTSEEFAEWAAERGLTYQSIENVIELAATPQEMKAAFDAVEPPPPIYTLQDIKDMTDDDAYGIAPLGYGFVLIGGCPNGDPIALDVADDPGSVWYIYHGSMHSSPLREVAIRVADSVESFMTGLETDEEFPFDYYDAKQTSE